MLKHTFFHSTPYRKSRSKENGSRDHPDLEALTKSRKNIALSLKVYAPRLADIDPAMFKYKNPYQYRALEDELINTFSLLYDECQLHMAEKNLPLLRERGTQLERCANLLYRLHNTPQFESCEQAHQASLDTSPDKPVKYIALTTIAPLIAATMLGFTSEEGLEDITSKMSAANLHRLNWVWGGGLDRAVLDQVPPGTGHPARAIEIFAAIAPFTGYMSWVLYYLRFGINLYLLTKGSLKGSWMNPWRTEADIAMNSGIYERFQTQWELRKFMLLNDVFWGTANLACFFWLVGSGTLGYLGNALTFALLGFDVGLTCWRYAEEETRHHEEVLQYKEEINTLIARMSKETDETELKILEEHLVVLLAAFDKHALAWKFTQKNLGHDLIYAIGLMMAFGILCCFFFPPAGLLPATIITLGMAGAALSFALTIAYHAWTTNTEIEQLQALSDNIEKKIVALDKKLESLIIMSIHNENEPEKRKITIQINGLILEKTHLTADHEYQQSIIVHRKKELAQQILSEILVPASTFVLLVFLPLSLGVPILIPVVLLMMMSGTILDQWKPADPKEQPLLGREGGMSQGI